MIDWNSASRTLNEYAAGWVWGAGFCPTAGCSTAGVSTTLWATGWTFAGSTAGGAGTDEAALHVGEITLRCEHQVASAGADVDPKLDCDDIFKHNTQLR